jgi:hypothetical protein
MKPGILMACGLIVAVAGSAAIAQNYPDGGGNPDGRHSGRHHGRDDGPPRAVLFSKPGFQGHSFYADHEVRKLSTKDMDDKVSSIRILSGVWQVCVDDKFEGRCEIVDHSMADTREINMDNKISSVRPVQPRGGGWQR